MAKRKSIPVPTKYFKDESRTSGTQSTGRKITRNGKKKQVQG